MDCTRIQLGVVIGAGFAPNTRLRRKERAGRSHWLPHWRTGSFRCGPREWRRRCCNLRGSEFAGICLLIARAGASVRRQPVAPGRRHSVADSRRAGDSRRAARKSCGPTAGFEELTGASEPPIGGGFYDAFGAPEILGPDLSPFHTALGTGTSAHSTLRLGEKTYFQVHATPVTSPEQPRSRLPGRVGARCLGRDPAAAETERDLSGRAGTGRPVAAGTAAR